MSPRSSTWVLLGAAALMLPCGCEEEPGPFEFVGRLVVVEGRVVGPDDVPVGDARVEMASGALPEEPSRVVATTTSDAEGRFRFEPKRSDAAHHLIVRIPGASHGYLVGTIPAEGPENHRVGDLPIAPDRELVLVVECAGPLIMDPARSRPLPVRARLEWSGRQLIDRQLLPPDETTAQPGLAARLEDPTWPGVDQYLFPPPANARRFARRLRLPAGTHRVHVSGACGELTMSIEVPVPGDLQRVVLNP